jgi:NAD(P) transhydrogenase subunit alpha
MLLRNRKGQEGERFMIIGVVRESFPGERRVALVPASVQGLVKAGVEVLVQAGAGIEAGYPDEAYRQKGATLVPTREEVFGRSDVMFHLLGLGANPESGRADLTLYRPGQSAFGFFRPLGDPESVRELAGTGVSAFSIELLPRITRAQGMDALSSMANIAGYKAVLLAADTLPRMFPMLMTAAGTISPSRVLVVGVGVAGLQAIATAKRLGAVVSAYDIRPAVKEQVQSLGAKFVELALETEGAEDVGGYAKAQAEEFIRRQQELLAKVVAESDVVITTANVPGRKAPVLVTSAMVSGMSPGSVVVDLAAERGGNCEATRPGETAVVDGVTVMGPVNPAGLVPFHASQMYSSNVSTLLLHMAKDGALMLDLDDEIIRETLITRGGEVVHPRVREALGLGPLAPVGVEIEDEARRS